MDILKVVMAADIIIENNDGGIILIKRANDPYKNMWALPGGIMDEGETIEQTAVREAKEETGLDVEITKLIGVYSKPGRDPRGRTVTVTFSAKITGGIPRAADDAKEILETNEYANMKLAFDHGEMLKDFIHQKKR